MCKKYKKCTIDRAIFSKNCTMDRAFCQNFSPNLSKPLQTTYQDIPKVSPQNLPKNSNFLRLPNIQKVKINKDSVNIFTIVKFT